MFRIGFADGYKWERAVRSVDRTTADENVPEMVPYGSDEPLLISNVTDWNPRAQSRNPMDMMGQG